MSNPYLTVVAEMTAKPGCEEALKAVLTSLVAPTRSEEGCICYDLHVATGEPGKFLFFEKWTGQDALSKHLASEHLRSAGAKAQELTDGPPSIRTFLKLI